MLICTQEPPAPTRLRPKIPRDLETICLKCLEKVPGKRYASAGALAQDLERFLGGESITARPAPLAERLRKWTRRRPALVTLAACVSLVLPAVLAGILWHHADLKARLDQAGLGPPDGGPAQT